MALVWDQATFEEMYVFPSWDHGIRGSPRVPSFHYHAFAQRDRLVALVDMYINQPGFAQVSHVAIVGGGFGWTAEILATHGITAVSVDTSPYIVGNEAVSEETELRAALTTQGFDPDALPTFMSDVDPNVELSQAEIWAKWLRADGVRTSIAVENEDLANNGSRNRVKARLGNQMDAIITEDVLEGQETEAEALTIIDRCEALRPNPTVPVIHLVSGVLETDPRLIAKTMAEWRTLLDANGFSQHVLVNYQGVQG